MTGAAALADRRVFEVVAAVVTRGGRLCMLRRSPYVSSDAGRWHCITGFLPRREAPLRQALREIHEEAGIDGDSLEMRGTTVIDQLGRDGKRWRIHAFHFESSTEQVQLNWEHDAVMWTLPDDLEGVPTVSWLGDLLAEFSLQACHGTSLHHARDEAPVPAVLSA